MDSDDDDCVSSVSTFDTEYNEFEPYSEVGSNDDLHSYSSDSDLEIVSTPFAVFFCVYKIQKLHYSSTWCDFIDEH